MKLFLKAKNVLCSLYFNFRVLPFKDAIKLPFWIGVWPTVLFNKGKIVFESPIKRGMIKIGFQRTPVYRKREFIWSNLGTIVFKGKCRMGHHMMILVKPDAYLEFGDLTAFNAGCRIGCYKKIIFGYRARVSWDCQFYDTDFHPLIDMVRDKPLKMNIPIKIGDNTWIGHNVIVSKGVKLSDGIIVSSGSIVKNSFSINNCIIAGNPAAIIDEGYKPVLEDLGF